MRINEIDTSQRNLRSFLPLTRRGPGIGISRSTDAGFDEAFAAMGLKIVSKYLSIKRDIAFGMPQSCMIL